MNALVKKGKPQTWFNAKWLRSCRFQFMNPETCEVTFLYVTHTDKDKFRVKTFRGGKCLQKSDVKADSFATLLNNLNDIL
jgi:hypothetical protein